MVNLLGRKIPDCFAAADAVRFFDFLCPSRYLCLNFVNILIGLRH